DQKLIDAIPSRNRALNAVDKKLGIIGLGETGSFLAKVACFLRLVRHRSRQNHFGALAGFLSSSGPAQTRPVFRGLGRRRARYRSSSYVRSRPEALRLCS